MPYSSYTAFIVQNNGLVIFGIAVLNNLVTKLNISFLNRFFNWYPVKTFEFLLLLWCFWNIYSGSRNVVNPFLSNFRLPFQDYVFKSGPVITALSKANQFIFSDLYTKKLTTTTNPSPVAAATAPSATQTLLDLKNPLNVQKVFFQFIANKSQNQQTELVPLQGMFPIAKTSSAPVSSSRDAFAPEVSARLNLLSFKQSNASTGASGATLSLPKLKYTPCIKPPLEPSQHRERILWYLSPTPEVIDDFRIEQILGFQKNWHKFNDRLSRIYYDRMMNVLMKKIFIPLSKSIESFNAILATQNQNLATCPPGTIALAQLIPNFNYESAFSIAEVAKFITLDNHNTPDALQYVMERIKELSSNNKMAAYRFRPKADNMPADSEIIMHIFKYYLRLREPYAIPPLVPEEGDLFKFLLIYIYLTPELDHWKVFNLDL